MNARKLYHRLEYGAYRAVFGITQRLPQRALRGWGRAVGKVAFHVFTRRRALTLDNLARALPELDAGARRRIARLCFERLGETYHEQVWAMGRTDEIVERFEIVGLEHLERARARGKGLFVLTGHYGCWELAGYPLGRMLGKLYIVARPQNNPYIAADFEGLRERNGNQQIDRGRAGFRMLKVLKQGGAIGIAIDQRVRPAHGLLVPFLGRYAWTSRLPAFLATKTGCAAVPMVCAPLPDGRYRMTIDEPILPEGEGEDEIERLTRLYAVALEPHIRACPELWLWPHSRWRRTVRHRQPRAVERIVEQAGAPPLAPLDEVARRAGPASAVERLLHCVSPGFLEDVRHLVLAAAEPRRLSIEPLAAGAGGTPAAAALADAFARMGYATRYLAAGDLLDALERERDAGRLEAALRDLDRTALLVVDEAWPARLESSRLELLARFLGHRLERGSVILAGAGAPAWRDAAARCSLEGGSLSRFVAACEALDVSALDPALFLVASRAARLPGSEPEAEAEAV